MRFAGLRPFIRALSVLAFVCALKAVGSAQSSKETRPLDPIANTNGKPVVLFFLRTDCPISKRYAPTIQKLDAKYDEKAEFYLVFPSKNDSTQLISGHTREFGYKIQALRDPNHALVNRAHATITPEAALFDSHGVLRYHGRIDDLYVSLGKSRQAPTTHDLEDALTAVLAGKPVNNDTEPAVGCYIADAK